MRQLRSLLTCATVFMLAILLHLSVLSGFTETDTGAPSGGVEIAQTHEGGSGQPTATTDVDNFKPPKQSFVDYSDFLLTGSIQTPVALSETHRGAVNRYRLPPDVYLDIFIPPDRSA